MLPLLKTYIITMEEISIDKELKEFKNHLSINERTIFSAKFGDGKTYFLNKFKEKYSDDFEFITLYPVNYQIAENKDVFEYIKRDILIQLFMKNMIPDSIKIPKALIIQFYLMHKAGTLLSNLIETANLIGLTNPNIINFIKCYTAVKGLSNISKDFKEYEQAIKDRDDEAIAENYIGGFTQEKGSPYEIDLITHLIIKSIESYKEEHPQKHVVLIIEDLDRLDPAHLFRILNVFSAHIDRVYQLSSTKEPSESEKMPELLSNKFGFDNIVTVFDYDNTKDIFTHFYGNTACYEGYISKFLSTNPFSYSIHQVAYNEFKEFLYAQCRLYVDKLYQDIQKKFYALSIRDMKKVVDGCKDIIKNFNHKVSDDITFNTYNSFSIFISILILSGINKHDIKTYFQYMDIELIYPCINSYIYVIESMRNITTYVVINGKCYAKENTINDKNIIIDVQLTDTGRIYRNTEDTVVKNLSLNHIKIDECIDFVFDNVIIN